MERHTCIMIFWESLVVLKNFTKIHITSSWFHQPSTNMFYPKSTGKCFNLDHICSFHITSGILYPKQEPLGVKKPLLQLGNPIKHLQFGEPIKFNLSWILGKSAQKWILAPSLPCQFLLCHLRNPNLAPNLKSMTHLSSSSSILLVWMISRIKTMFQSIIIFSF